MKRVFLFLATNFAILIVLGVVLSILMPVLGIDSQSNAGLLLFCAVFGMGGSFRVPGDVKVDRQAKRRGSGYRTAGQSAGKLAD